MVILILLLLFSSLQSTVNLNVDKNIQDPIELSRSIIEQKEDPQIVLWYGGESGVNIEAAQFYKEQIFEEFNNQKKPFKFYLYDLIAWGALRNLKASIKTKNKLAESITKENYSFIQSADFFEDLIEEKDPEIIDHYNEGILSKSSLFTPSNGRKPNNIKVKDVVCAESIKAIHNLDTAYAYSPLQYLEGLYLAKRIAKSQSKRTNIIFMLPNDEYKYYTSSRLNGDLDKIIKEDVDISFVNFKYGDQLYKRPYISRAKKVKKTEIENYLS